MFILSIGSTSNVRDRAMRDAGMTVFPAASVSEALAMIARENINILVAGANLSPDDRERLTVALKARCRNAKVIMLYRGGITRGELADAIINADDVQLLLETIRDFREAKGRSECA